MKSGSMFLAVFFLISAEIATGPCLGDEPKEMLSEATSAPIVDEIRVIRSNGKKTMVHNGSILEYSDPALSRLVAPVWESKLLMGTKRIIKPVSLTAVSVGIGLIAYSLSFMTMDGGAEEAWKYRKIGLIVGGSGFAAFVFQIPLSDLAISSFNRRSERSKRKQGL